MSLWTENLQKHSSAAEMASSRERGRRRSTWAPKPEGVLAFG